MAIRIANNISSLRAVRQTDRATQALNRTSQRLSSGLRINRASDDAAGLAIASSLQVDTRVYQQGIRNINDAVSYLSIADGAATELTSIVTRLRELAEQSANGVYSDKQREGLAGEVDALKREYQRILESTSFNGMRIFGVENGTISVAGGFSSLLDVTVAAAGAEYSNAAQLLSSSSAGVISNSGAQAVSAISADGRYIAMTSDSSNLVAGDGNGATDVFVKDRLTGEIRKVSGAFGGGDGNGTATISVSISANGRYVGFASSSTNLVAGGTTGTQLFIYDMVTGITSVGSTDANGVAYGGTATSSSFSADGRYVAFEYAGAGLVAGDTNGVTDVYVKDLQTGAIQRASVSTAGVETNNASTNVTLSADGKTVAFRSLATNLVAGDNNGASDIFIRSLVTGETTRVSTSASGAEGNAASQNSFLSADGRYIAFQTTATNLFSGDTNGVNDVVLKDLVTGEVTLVSSDSSGVLGNGASSSGQLSADGRFVTFESASTNLITNDGNAFVDAFVKDMYTGRTTRVNLTNTGAVSNGPAGGTPAITPDGRYVSYITAASNMVPGDGNGTSDLFISGVIGDLAISPLGGVTIRNADVARQSLDILSRNATEIQSLRASIGVGISRLGHDTQNLASTVENYTAASSRITDTDIAEEAADRVRLSILQNAAVAVLSKSNLEPELALRLFTA